MAIPPPPGPPPPPCPPPPPAMGGLKLSGAAGGDVRSALLQSIQKGTKLKKTTMVDKSGPSLSGKVCDSSSSPTAGSLKRTNNNNNNNNTSSSNNNHNKIGNGAPKLGGIFEGLSSMPKLKPVNGSRAPTTTKSTLQRTSDTNATNSRSVSPPTAAATAAAAPTAAASSNGPMDFNTELTKHLTLKRQKQQINATEANLRTNRGPPPQPPTAPTVPTKNLSTSSSDSVLEKTKTTTAATSVRSQVLAKENIKASSPTLSEGSSGSGGSTVSSKVTGGSNSTGSVKSKAATLSLSLGINTNFVNNISNQNTTTTTTTNYNNNSSSSYTAPVILPQQQLFTLKTTTTTTSVTPIRNLPPNKSTLFGTNVGSGGSSSSGGMGNGAGTGSPSILSAVGNKSPTPGVKPVPNYGKPNFAPKPPGLQQLINGQRPAVARHHSMKSPRSPPIATASSGVLVFPTQQHFATMRTPLQLCQSQEAINLHVRTAPNPPIGRPTVAPPKPPSVKPPPPPTPARSISNSNLNGLVYAVSAASYNEANTPTAVTAASTPPAQPPSNSSSSSSVSTLRDQFRMGASATPPPPPPPSSAAMTNKSASSPVSKSKSTREKGPTPIILNGGPIIAPPLPPHRTCPAPPPPQRQSSHTGGVAPPVPPQRHSSIRANAPILPHTANTTPSFGNISSSGGGGGGGLSNATSVSRLVIDLESKFGKRFHNVTEFPKPPPFLSIQKVYPSRTVKTTNVPNNNNNMADNNNTFTIPTTTANTSTANTPKVLQPSYQPMKKHRAPAPPPQAGVAAATVSVIRQSSFLYGGQTPQQQTAASNEDTTRNLNPIY